MPENFNITEIFTKLILRNDVLSNWEDSDVILERGEPALEMDLEKRVAKIKIGDGYHTFNELPYSTATPDEIQEMINASMTEGGAINSVSLSSGTENGTVKLTVNGIDYDNIAVTGLGSAAFTDSSSYATAEQGEKADKALSFKGTTDVLPTDNVSIGDTYKAVSNFTISTDNSYTGEEVSVISGDTITVADNGKWVVLSSISAPAKVTTDDIVQGANVIILNGGNAAG